MIRWFDGEEKSPRRIRPLQTKKMFSLHSVRRPSGQRQILATSRAVMLKNQRYRNRNIYPSPLHLRWSVTTNPTIRARPRWMPCCKSWRQKRIGYLENRRDLFLKRRGVLWSHPRNTWQPIYLLEISHLQSLSESIELFLFLRFKWHSHSHCLLPPWHHSLRRANVYSSSCFLCFFCSTNREDLSDLFLQFGEALLVFVSGSRFCLVVSLGGVVGFLDMRLILWTPGELFSIKIMWPRTPAERSRKRNTGKSEDVYESMRLIRIVNSCQRAIRFCVFHEQGGCRRSDGGV